MHIAANRHTIGAIDMFADCLLLLLLCMKLNTLNVLYVRIASGSYHITRSQLSQIGVRLMRMNEMRSYSCCCVE